MSAAAAEVVREFISPIVARGGLKASLLRDDVRELIGRLVEPDAPVEFAVPSGGVVGPMGRPFTGPEGYLAGWEEWLEPWDEFVIDFGELTDAGSGKVLQLAAVHGRMGGTGASLAQQAGALYTVAGARIVRIEHFLDQRQARVAAGLA